MSRRRSHKLTSAYGKVLGRAILPLLCQSQHLRMKRLRIVKARNRSVGPANCHLLVCLPAKYWSISYNMITRYHHSTHTAKITVDHCLRMEVSEPHGYFEHLIINVSYEVKNKLVGSKVRLTHLAKGTTPPVESRWYIQSFMLPFCIQSETIQQYGSKLVWSMPRNGRTKRCRRVCHNNASLRSVC